MGLSTCPQTRFLNPLKNAYKETYTFDALKEWGEDISYRNKESERKKTRMTTS